MLVPGLSIRDVRQSLSLLLHHDLVSVSESRKPGSPDYTVQVKVYQDQILDVTCIFNKDDFRTISSPKAEFNLSF